MTNLTSAASMLSVGIVSAMLAAAPALSQTKDHAPVAIPGANLATQDKAGSESWTYVNPSAVFPNYRTVIVEPTTVYTGADAQFGDIEPADRTKFAAVMTDELRSEIGKSFPAPAKAAADTLRIRVILIGAEKTKGGVATATRATPVGLGLNAFKSALGKGGTFTGSLLYAIEGYNGKSGELLFTAVRRRSPDPLDIPATLSTAETVKAVARDFAENARKKLENMTGVATAAR